VGKILRELPGILGDIDIGAHIFIMHLLQLTCKN
jgi:hypothetical protein